MSFEQGLDFDFQLLDQDFLLEYEQENSGSVKLNVDDIFDQEPKNPVHGNDLSLATTLNFSSDDDFLACAPTDESPLEVFQQQVKSFDFEVSKKQSPWHESDSGMSDTTPSSSPQRSVQEANSNCHPAPSMEFLNVNVDDLDFDIDQCSPSSSYTTSPPHISPTSHIENEDVSLADDLITEENVQQKQALEFFNSYSTRPKTLKLVKVQQAEGTEDKSRKNAIQAKVNREKKKAYIKSLEDEITSLRGDNAKLTSENKKMKSTMSDLEEEVEYLKSVLVNSSSLSGLLKNISNVNEVKLSATVIGKKRSIVDDHSYNFIESAPQKRARRINENLKKAGVCLHVNGDSACLEFCAHCSKLAQRSSRS